MIKFLRLFKTASVLMPLCFKKNAENRGEMICVALESLGPIYVKFGQLLSTRGDLIPEDIATALQRLQDNVAPFDGQLAIRIIENNFKKKIADLFEHFDEKPLASASIAQVHSAVLKTGESVVLKIIRPNIKKIIRQDIALLKFLATCVEKYWRHGKRLRAIELVTEYEKVIHDELDLVREAANAAQLKRNFEHSTTIYVPTIYWSLTTENIMTMERIYGVSIGDIEKLKLLNVNLKKLAEHGVEIFFTQVFRDSFFHADMHPGNLFVDVKDPENPVYLGVDFGIMGSLSTKDQHYLANNILAFLSRDYKRIAELHIKSGWVLQNTRVDEFESAIRTVCEPIFQKPLSEIYFGQLLLKLFQTAERFNMTVQPQLFLLQKTLFYIESLGKKLYPELDLWETAKPFMTRWMKKQYSLKTLAKSAFQDWRANTEQLLKLPNLAYSVLLKIQETQLTESASVVRSKPHLSKKIRYFCAGFTIALLIYTVVILCIYK